MPKYCHSTLYKAVFPRHHAIEKGCMEIALMHYSNPSARQLANIVRWFSVRRRHNDTRRNFQSLILFVTWYRKFQNNPQHSYMRNIGIIFLKNLYSDDCPTLCQVLTLWIRSYPRLSENVLPKLKNLIWLKNWTSIALANSVQIQPSSYVRQITFCSRYCIVWHTTRRFLIHFNTMKKGILFR